MSAPSKLSSTPPPPANAAGSAEAVRESAEATRESEGAERDGTAGSIAEPGNNSGWDGWPELSTWGPVAVGKCAARSALRTAAMGSVWGVEPVNFCLSAEQQGNKQIITATAQHGSIRRNTLCHPTPCTAPPSSRKQPSGNISAGTNATPYYII